MESLVTQALGTRAKAVRAFRRRLQGAPDLADSSPAGARLDVLLAAQVITDSPSSVDSMSQYINIVHPRGLDGMLCYDERFPFCASPGMLLEHSA